MIPGLIPRAQVRSTLTYKILPTLTAGIEYNPRVDEVNPLINWVAITETARRPALMFGISSDRIGTPSGKSVFATVSKNIKRETGLPFAPYVGVTYGSFDDRVRAIGGLNINFSERVSGLVMFDGVRVHPLLNFSYDRHVFSFIMVKGREPG
ncbi:MAG TPA: hypothetical protein VLD57_02600, partial [Blastocatellia bacterium]|nr:hypothetical protein [Blastocatellia bacterium]